MLAMLLAAQVYAAPPSAVDYLKWLAGCWTLNQSGSVIEEQWMAPSGGVMLGMGRTVEQNGALREFEFMRIIQTHTSLAFVAQPSGQAETTFPLLLLSEMDAVFENRDHDFPQRVIYRRLGPDTVTARIEGEIDGQPKAIDFPYKRCASGN
jgi:hypothetical protein